MSFLDKLKDFQNQLSQVESNIHNNKQDFLEIFERNVQLEREISERSKELDVANQRMLTLQHILDMMNASKPISNVLDAIVKTLQGDLGYLHSCIIQKKEDEKGLYMKVITQAQDELTSRVDDIMGKPFESMRLTYDENGIFVQALNEKKIIQSVDLRAGIKAATPYMPEDIVTRVLNKAKTQSFIVIPLYVRNNPYGVLVVFSIREKAEDAELDFLNLFAKQIELAITIADLFQVVKNQAITDPLTNLNNRRYFEEFMQNEVVRAQRTGQPFTLIGIDLDYLKQINDKHGHSFGDLAIKTVADVLKKNARSIDVAARMGGEEFNVLLPGIDSKGGLIAAERIRSAIADCKLDTVGHITASVGVATFLEHSDKLDEIIEITDQAMYAAKRNGRNQVQLAKPMAEVSWQEVAMNAFVDILSKNRIPVPQEVSKDLCKKIMKTSKEKASPKDMLYNVADILAKTYNPLHNDGVTKSKILMATNLAKIFDLSNDDVDKLRIAVLLYDIGNVLLPQHILQKNGPLTDAEKNEIQKHPVFAARDILKPISEIQDVIPIIEYHHENWDGSGYPGKVSGEKIPLASQIILITDAYFALIEPRSYRQAMTIDEALEVIKKDANKKWSEALVREFVSLVKNDLK